MAPDFKQTSVLGALAPWRGTSVLKLGDSGNNKLNMKTILDNPFLRYLAVALICFSLLMVTGCSGCQDKEDSKAAKKEEDKKKKKKKKKKPDYESRRAVILPGYFHKPKTPEELKKEKENPAAAAMDNLNRPSVTKNRTKLGHWVTSNFQAIANNFNAEGQLETYSQTGTSTPVRIPSTDYYISSSRPVSLPKGEWKNFETTVFLPTRSGRARSASINYQISRTASGLPQIHSFDSSLLMKPHEFHFLILSTRPDDYRFLEFADSIRLPGSKIEGGRIDPFYLIVPSIPDDPLPLPRHALNWTTIAYLVWDDYDPDLLEPEHKQAILDWIHFGGQLIVSGPDSLDKLQDSFLSEYLPAHFERSRNLTSADIKELNENWTVKLRRNPAEQRKLQISNTVPLLGVDFKPHDDAEFIDGTGGIAIERTLGRGRIVITAFSLNSPSIRKWRSFKSFFNGALLRKPARNFGKVRNDEGTIVFEWADDATSIFDPLLGSTLRFLSRDLSRNGTEKTVSSASGVAAADEAPLDQGFGNSGFGYNSYVNDNPHMKIQRSRISGLERNLDNHRYYGGFQDAPQSGVAGWNDRSGISHAARESLKLAAGIKPPSSGFVLKMLAAYLLVLVPLNWLIFRLIGRVEYAWIAAPLIAIAGAFLVIKFASLDIGFVRSNTQVGVLEIQANYSRAHLAEYSALYTSLSTRYSAELDNLTAQSLPFATDDNPSNFQPKATLSEVQLRRTVKNRLEGFQIQSNTTGLVHTEYLLDLTGVVSFVPPKSDDPDSGSIGNSTNVGISNAGVVGRTEDGEYRVAWIGELAAGNESDLSFSDTTLESLKQPWLKIPVFSNSKRAAENIWNTNVKDSKSASLEEISLFPELSDRWPDYKRMFLRSNDSNSNETEYFYTQPQFEQIYQSVNSNSEIGIGRMFDAVADNLTIAPGEYRLIGSSSQRLGKTKFDPDSTQVEQQTLVVVHLQHPKLPVAKPDLNSLEEFKSARSNLNVEEELKELEEELTP